MCNVVHLVRIDPKTKSEVQESYAWDPNKKVSKAILQKSKAARLELWSLEDKDVLVEKGWFPAKRSDGSDIVSEKGYRLYTFPERPRLKPFPY